MTCENGFWVGRGGQAWNKTNGRGLLYSVKAIVPVDEEGLCKNGMPIKKNLSWFEQELERCNEADWLVMKTGQDEARKLENDLAKKGPEWESETEYLLKLRKLDEKVLGAYKKCNKFSELEMQVN